MRITFDAPSAPGLNFSRFFDEILMIALPRENSSALESRVTFDVEYNFI